MFTGPAASVADGLLALIGDPKAVKKVLEDISKRTKDAEAAEAAAVEARDALNADRKFIVDGTEEVSRKKVELEKREKVIADKEKFLETREAMIAENTRTLESRTRQAEEINAGAARRAKEIELAEAALERRRVQLDNRTAEITEKENNLIAQQRILDGKFANIAAIATEKA